MKIFMAAQGTVLQLMENNMECIHNVYVSRLSELQTSLFNTQLKIQSQFFFVKRGGNIL